MNLAALYLLASLIVIGIGSFALGKWAAESHRPVLRAGLLAAGALTPFWCAAAMFIIFKPSEIMTYNLIPFGLAIAALPFSSVITFWGRWHQGQG